MPANTASKDYSRAVVKSAIADRIVYFQHKFSRPILGTVLDLTSPVGVNFSSFYLPAQGYAMPIVWLEQASPYITVTIGDETMAEHFAEPWRRRLAGVYAEYCEHFEVPLDDHCTLNVVYYLELAGITTLTDDNLIEVATIIKDVREAYYRFVAAVALKEEMPLH